MRVLDPASSLSLEIARFFNGVFLLSCVIFAIVTFLVVYALIRYRAPAANAEAPSQSHGHRALEIAWTVLPLLTVAVIFVFTVRVMYSTQPNFVPHPPDIHIAGRQWWWQVRYANGAYTANEIHIPTGQLLSVWLEDADVIHDFWVPQLGPKIDIVPGRLNALWLRADHPGRYLGACAEYCGRQHAWMLIRVIAQPPDEFASWLAAQAVAAPHPSNPDAERGARLFTERTCINCHAIAGTTADARVGPDLTHIASRETLGAGILANTPQNLADWIADPQRIKPGILMPALKLSPDEVRAIAAYLETLR
jgi:cytochrome c oxidase subunit II